MTSQPAGWYPDDSHPYDNRWWDGSEWVHAFWPHSRPKSAYLPESRRWDISSGGQPNFDVVGENWHETGIASVLGRRPGLDEEIERYATAELVPEPDNPHDANAICVRIEGEAVGYLSADAARAYQPLVHALVRSDVVATVQARIWAVTRFSRQRNRQELKSAIRLALPEPTTVLPVNGSPSVPHAVVPRGRKVQVTGESDHFDVLAPFIGASGYLLTTLHRIEIVKARSTSPAIEVRVGNRRVGQLTAATSASLLPLVVEADRLGLATAAWGSLTGSRLAAELALHVAKAEEVPAAWPSVEDAIPAMKEARQVPPAYASTEAIESPPSSSGLSAGWWIVAVVLTLILFAVPYIGWLLALGLLLAAFLLHRRAKRRAPAASFSQPSVPLRV